MEKENTPQTPQKKKINIDEETKKVLRDARKPEFSEEEIEIVDKFIDGDLIQLNKKEVKHG